MKPMRLVTDDLSTDLGECLDQLRLMYEQRKLRGIAFIGVLPGRVFIGNTAGVCHDDPTQTRGQLLGLDDKLSRRVHGD